MAEKIKVKNKTSLKTDKIRESDGLIVNNIKHEPEVEFVLILPPAIVNIENIKNEKIKVETKKKFRCENCSKSFDKKIYLYKHSFTHRPKVKCHICGKEINKEYLKYHMKIHEGIKPFECDFCSFSFVSKASLSRHMCRHRNENIGQVNRIAIVDFLIIHNFKTIF